MVEKLQSVAGGLEDSRHIHTSMCPIDVETNTSMKGNALMALSEIAVQHKPHCMQARSLIGTHRLTARRATTDLIIPFFFLCPINVLKV